MLRKDAASVNPVIISGEIQVENTTFCGANCVMCPRGELVRAPEHMSFRTFSTVLAQAAKLGVSSLNLTGLGDPLMDPGVWDKLTFAKECMPGILVYMSNTGHLFGEDTLPYLCRFFETIKISNYAFSHDTYRRVHGKGLQPERITNNILDLLAYRENRRPYIIMNYLLTADNESEMNDWVDYWEPKADEVMVWRPHNFGGNMQAAGLAFQTKAFVQRTNPRSCGRPFAGNPFVHANGDVTVCCFDINHELTLGNICQAPLENLLSNERMEKLQAVHRAPALAQCGLLCERCDQIFDRGDALVYTSNPLRRTNQVISHPDRSPSLDKISL